MGEQRKRNGCLWCGCLSAAGAVLVVLLAVGGVIAWNSNLPERLGVRQSPAQRLLSGPPDRQAAQQIVDDLAAAGVDTRGMWIYVLPMEDKPYRVAYAVLDAAEGFRFGRGGEGDAVLDYLVQLASGESIDALNIGRIGIDYRDEEGNPVIALTAPTAAIQAYARDIDPLWYTNQNIRDLEPVHDKLAASGWPDKAQCIKLNQELAIHYRQRHALTGSAADLAQAEAAESLVAACGE